MSPKRPRKASEGQEELMLHFKPVLEIGFPKHGEKAAADRRRFRHPTDPLALHPRTSPFMKRVNHLWIPYSGGENTLVLGSFKGKQRNDMSLAKERVRIKHQDSDVDSHRIEAWGRFASWAARDSLLKKVGDYSSDAWAAFQRLYSGVQPDYGYSSEFAKSSEPAMSELRRYVYTLKAFNGYNDDGRELVKRRWIQPHWSKVIAREHEWAGNYLDSINEVGFVEIFDEALYNSRCRHDYWREVQTANRANVFKSLMEAAFEDVPISCYANDPEAQSWYEDY